jgi:hypothetical protein
MPAASQDLSRELTVFVTTVGDKLNFDECLACLERQTVRFSLERIENVAPMSAAFNQMLLRCRTHWFVQVDEDMLLFPGAIKQLYDLMKEASGDVACIGASLWDCQVERPIYGIKIYRHDIVKAFAFPDTRTCDVDMHRQFEAAGYRLVELPLRWSREACLGEHGKHYTPRTAFLHWKRMFEKRRESGGKDWILPWPRRFLESYRQSGSQVDLYSFLGAVAGMCGELSPAREFNYQDPAEDFDRLFAAMRDSEMLKSRGRETLERTREWRLLFKQWLLPEWRRSKQ